MFKALWQSAVTYSTPFNVNKVLIERAVALSLSDTRIAGAVFGLGERRTNINIFLRTFSATVNCEKQFPNVLLQHCTYLRRSQEITRNGRSGANECRRMQRKSYEEIFL